MTVTVPLLTHFGAGALALVSQSQTGTPTTAVPSGAMPGSGNGRVICSNMSFSASATGSNGGSAGAWAKNFGAVVPMLPSVKRQVSA